MLSPSHRTPLPAKRPAPSAWRRDNQGFTLVELVVAVAIVAVLASLAAPSFSAMIANQRAKNTASDLYSDLLTARSEAVKRNANVTVTQKAGGWANGWQVTDALSNVLADHGATTGITFTGAPTSVTYQGSGRLQGGTTPSFSVSASAASTAQRCVTVDLSGRPYTKAGSC